MFSARFVGAVTAAWTATLLLLLQTPQCSGDVLRVGSILRMTESATHAINHLGAQRLPAVLMAIRDFNAQHGKANNLTVMHVNRDGGTTFYSSALAAANIETTAYPGWGGPDVLIGGGSDFSASAVAQMLQEYQVPLMGYGASGSQLSHGSQYPFFARVYPSSAFQARALAGFIR